MKSALLLCATHNDLGLIRALRKLGYYIIATGTKIDALGKNWVDEYLTVDYSDKDKILEIAREKDVDVICQCCNDFGVYTASYVAEKLGLPGYDSYETTLTLHNKDRFKAFSKKYGILTPEALYFTSDEEALREIPKMELPIIIKPVDASAGNGISKIEKAQEIKEAISYAFANSKSSRIVAEPYLTGKQYGFCTFLIDKKVVAIASNNEYSMANPYRVEIDTWPADNYSECRDFLVSQIEKMAEILELKDGIFHLQYIYADGKPWIIEVMRRILGNMYSVLSNPLNGFDWDYWETRAKCGLDCTGFPIGTLQEGFYAYKTVMAEKNGTIEHISVPTEYQKYIFDEYWVMKIGDEIENYLKQPIGFLFMMFRDREQMEDVLLKQYRCDLVNVKG
ncbi:MAG: ATP-grasp domain-containing protein [Lachnospiraceae bacterium]|nr:ATP-grasp domain-containing protein [Lachnospiraceae bacterium]